MSKDSNVVIYISPKINSRIMEYAQAADGEISGFGSINRNTDIFDKLFPILPQKCSGGETDMDAEFLHLFTTSGQSATYDVWWHSHANGGTFWSGQDESCINELGKSLCAGGNIPRPILSIVVNKKRGYLARVDIFKPVRFTVEAKLLFHYEFPYSEIEKIHREVKEKVKPTSYTSYPPYGQSKAVSKFPWTAPDTSTLQGMSAVELEEYGYKIDPVSKILVKMTADDWINKYAKKEKKNGNTDKRGSEFGDPELDFPPFSEGGHV